MPNRTEKKQERKISAALFTLGILVTALATALVDEPLRDYLRSRLNKQELSYRVLGVTTYHKHQLPAVAKGEDIRTFSLDLDDTILSDYQLVKVSLHNHGKVILGPISLSASFRNSDCKIVDIQSKVVIPTTKNALIIHSLPPLKWKMPELPCEIQLQADSPDGEAVAGMNVYRSFCRDVGYGRCNASVASGLQYGVVSPTSPLDPVCYYRVTVVDNMGRESELSEPVDIAYTSLAFRPWFMPRENETNHVVDTASSDTLGRIGPLSATVSSNETFSFLHGTATLCVLNGLEARGEIHFYFLCKARPGSDLSFAMKLDGSPEVALREPKTLFTYHIPEARRSPVEKEPHLLRINLTPAVVRTFGKTNSIIVAWTKPASARFKGVRIFRSPERKVYQPPSPDAELYDGPGESRPLYCTYATGILPTSIAASEGSPYFQSSETSRLLTPPRRSNATLAPPTPKNLVVQITDELQQQWYEDSTAVPGVVYTYALYAYDDAGSYSFPVLAYGSREDWTSSLMISDEAPPGYVAPPGTNYMVMSLRCTPLALSDFPTNVPLGLAERCLQDLRYNFYVSDGMSPPVVLSSDANSVRILVPRSP